YNISEKEIAKFNKIYNNNEKIVFLKKLKQLNSFQQTLKTENDFQEHTTEIAIPPLTNGHYLMYASTFKNLNAESLFATSTIQVTDLALVENKLNNNYTYQVVDRNNGKPISGAKVNIKNYNTGSYNNLIDKNYITDNNGQLNFIATKSHRNVIISIKNNKDKARFGDYYFSNYNSYTESKNYSVIKPFIFTDRSIYRPSQTVFFKGIFIEKEDEKSSPYADELVTASLYNVNNEKISELDLTTNEFGAVSGEFVLPNNGLLGNYSIQLNQLGLTNQRYYFSVEEYKRPKFETTFKPVTKTYKIDDSISINGSAIAFAGSTITNAKVTYRVHRKVQYPRWYYWHKPYFTPSEPQEIIHGETETNENGDYIITFKALADKSINKENLPIFYYEVTADVTDINGETRSASTLVKIGYHALITEINIAAIIDKNNKDNLLKIETKNLNNQPVSAKGTLKIYKLEAPNSVLRKRAWTAPDYQLYTVKDFKNKFPHEAFSNEDNVSNWKKGILVFESDFNTANSNEIALKNIKKWESGNYIIVSENNDKFGQIITDKQLITVFSKNDKQVSDNQLFSISLDKSSYKPNEIAILKVGSASKDITVTIDIEKDKKIIDTKTIHLNNEIKQLEIPITKSDLGGFAIHYSFTNFNSFESGTLPVSVPYPVKELEIETQTFRDKLLPGQQETWSFKLKGKKNEKVAAELLASMYDASLDQFKSHNWQFNPISYPVYYAQTNRRAHQSFGNKQFAINNLDRAYYGQIQQHFDALNWFGFRFNTNQIMIRGLSARKMQLVNDDVEVEEIAMVETEQDLDEVVTVGFGDQKKNEIVGAVESEKTDLSAVKIRKNFNETAFFYPHLRTDTNGNVSFSFTIPEALTQWKLQLLAHTKELVSATKTLTTVTQKELMVLPNPPRFLREGDVLQFSSKISNLTDKSLNGIAQLVLTDAISGKDITNELMQTVTSTPLSNQQNFLVDAKGNTNIIWSLTIPNNVQAIQYNIVAKAGEFSDGEQNVLPLLSNRMLVTETLPMWVRSNQTRTFSLDKLKNN
ncbi:MG2 domain-containing protein, partial [Lutibacter sp.]|uniref:MG2 domain-containing protein n=1 Tax=Lutibacter sp. TaxID=1925666 RepID=UPI0034A085B3